MIKVGTTKIDLLNSRWLTLFDELPEEKRHSAEIVELLSLSIHTYKSPLIDAAG
jgi:hypothetical protein